MPALNWEPQGLHNLAIVLAAYSALAAILALRRQWALPTAAIAFVAVTAASGQLLALLAVVVLLVAVRISGGMAKLSGFVAFAFGLAILQTLIACMAWIPIHFTVIYWILATLFLLRHRQAVVELSRSVRLIHLTGPQYVASCLLGFVLLCHLAVAMLPEVSSDGLTVHMNVLEILRYEHRWEFDASRFSWAVTPMGGDWSYAPAFMMGGEPAARLLNWAALCGICGLIVEAFPDWSISRRLLLAALFASTPLVQLVSGSLFVENIWAYFLTAGLICAWRGDVFPAAVLLGSACATKVGSWLPALATLGLLWFWHRIRIKSVVTFLLFAVPPYFTAWLQTGNPIFPFANATFRAPLFDLANSFVEARYQEPIRWDILYRLTFESHRFFEGTDGALGFQYLFAAPFVLLAMRGFRRLEMLASAAVLAAFVGLSLSQSNLRYLYPVMPAATILIGCAWRNLAPQTRWVAPAIAVVLVANICYLSNSGWHHRNFGPAPWRADAVAQYRDLQAPVRTMIDYLNLHHPGEPVIFLASGQSAGLHARAFIDSWHQYPFHERALACRNGAEWKELSNSLGVHLVLGPSGAAFTGSQSDFLQNYTEPVLSDGDLRLFRIKQ